MSAARRPARTHAAPGVPSRRQPAPAVTETRDRILDEAEVLFAEHGLAGTSVRDIAARVGVTPASLYNHFPGKEALYRAVLARGLAPLLEQLAEIAGREADPQHAARLIEGVMEHLARRPHLPRLVALEAATGGDHLKSLARDWIRPLVEQGLDALDRERLAGRSAFDEQEQAWAIAAWVHLVFGHFAMAPLLHEVLGRDPLAPESLAQQTGLLRKLAVGMARAAEPDAGEEP